MASVRNTGAKVDRGAAEVVADDLARQPHTGIGCLQRKQLIEPIVTSERQLSRAIEHREFFGVTVGIVFQHQTPSVPWQQLAFCACGNVTNNVATYEPQPEHVENA